MDEETEPTDTYSIDCTGDAVVGDNVRFSEAMFGGSHRRPRFLGVRTIEGEITSDSYGDPQERGASTPAFTTPSGVISPSAKSRID